VESNGHQPLSTRADSRDVDEWSASGVSTRTIRPANWLFHSREARVLWLVVRVYLGYLWLNAGYQKIWGKENLVFWSGGGAGVKGFATAGVAGSTAGKGAGASYGWWAGFLHNFVIPNSSWIAKFIACGEFLIGVALILGLFTGVFAFAALSLNLVYMFTGSAGVNPMYAIMAVLLVLAWRNAGWFGLDRFVLRAPGPIQRLRNAVGLGTPRPAPVIAAAT
jgi:thiosulfate dehydrogenase [quinone] large subunit